MSISSWRIDAGGWRAGDVADIVGAGAARAKPQVLHRFDHANGVLGLDLADLQIGARGHVRIAAAVAFGEIGKARELRRLENAVGHAQPTHIGILVRRHIEQAEKPPTEIIRRFRKFVARREVLEPLVGVEWVFVALEFLRIGELAAGGENLVLRLERGGIGTDRLGSDRRAGTCGPSARDAFCGFGDLRAGDKAFQIAFLFGVEVASSPPRPPA